jgi:hypothetical protein
LFDIGDYYFTLVGTALAYVTLSLLKRVERNHC